MSPDDEYVTTTFGPLENGEIVNPKAAFGAAKAPLRHIPDSALVWLGNVMAGGAYKYGAFNFRESAVDTDIYVDAMRRHLTKWLSGIDRDAESGCPELAHVMACCAILIDAELHGTLVDNRAKSPLMAALLEESANVYNNFRQAHDRRFGGG